MSTNPRKRKAVQQANLTTIEEQGVTTAQPPTQPLAPNSTVTTTTLQPQPQSNVTMTGPSTSNVLVTTNMSSSTGPYMGGINMSTAARRNAQMGINTSSSSSSAITTTTDEQEPTEAEIQAIAEQMRQAMAAQRQSLSSQAQTVLTTGSSSSATPQQQQQQGLIQAAIEVGKDFWRVLALSSRLDQFKAYISKKYNDSIKQKLLIDLKDRTGVQYIPSPSLDIVRWQSPEGLAAADRNYKSGVAQITALVELFTIYDYLKENLPTLQNFDPIDKANVVSIQRQYAESYFVFVYLNQEHINAALETIRLLERSIAFSKNNTLARTRSVTTKDGEIVTTLESKTIASFNVMYNLLDKNAITSVSPIIGTQITSIFKLPDISDKMPAAKVLYNSIVQKRNAAIGLRSKNVQERQITSGPLAGLAVVQLPSSNKIDINYISSEMMEADRAFEDYIAQITSGKIIPRPVNLDALRGALPLPEILSSQNAPPSSSTSNIMGTSGNTNANDGSSSNANNNGANDDVDDLGGGARRHRRTQKHKQHKRRQTRRRSNAKKQSRRSRRAKQSRR